MNEVERLEDCIHNTIESIGNFSDARIRIVRAHDFIVVDKTIDPNAINEEGGVMRALNAIIDRYTQGMAQYTDLIEVEGQQLFNIVDSIITSYAEALTFTRLFRKNKENLTPLIEAIENVRDDVIAMRDDFQSTREKLQYTIKDTAVQTRFVSTLTLLEDRLSQYAVRLEECCVQTKQITVLTPTA